MNLGSEVMKRKIFLIIIVLIILLFTSLILYNNYKNSVSNETAAVDLYKKLIDIAISSDGGISNECEYISVLVNDFVDPLNGTVISQNAKQEILDYCKKYNKVIYDKTYQELIDSDDTNIEDKKGYLIKIIMTFKNNNKATLNVMKYYDNFSSSMSQYIIEYINESWKYTDTGSKVQT